MFSLLRYLFNQYVGRFLMANVVVGTGINAPPAVLGNTQSAITQKYIKPFLADQIGLPSGTFWGLTRKGKKMKGGELVTPLKTIENPNGGAYSGAQLLGTTPIDAIQPANQYWRDYYMDLTLPVTDIISNSGSGLDLVQMTVESSSVDFMLKLNRALYHTAPQNTSMDIDDIESWIGSGLPATPNVGTVATNNIAGIDRSLAANSFWLPQTPVSAGGVALNTAVALSALSTVRVGYDAPDLMVMDQTRYAGFEANFVQNIRYIDNQQDKESVQAGIRYHFMFGNMVVLDDPFVPAHVAYLINTKYMYPVFHPGSYFRISPWLRATNQDVITSKVFLRWQLCDDNPRMGVKIYNIL